MSDEISEYTEDLLDECFDSFHHGLLCDETDNTDEACYLLKRGLDILKLAEKHEDCRNSEQYKNLVETKKKAEIRLEDLKRMAQSKRKSDVYENGSAEKQNIANEVRERYHEPELPDAELIFFIPNGVQLFMIEGDKTTGPRSCNSLEMFRLSKQSGSSSSAPMDGLIRAGPWSYPLKAGEVQILKNKSGAYVVPHPVENHPDMFIGLILPSYVNEKVEKEFVELLKQYAEVRDQTASAKPSREEPERMSDRISNMLIRGGERFSNTMASAAEKASARIAERSAKRRANMVPNEKPTSVHPMIKKGANCVSEGSMAFMKLTHNLFEKLGDVSLAAGQSISSGAEKTFGEGKVTETLDVVGSGLVGASTVWLGLEGALKTLCGSVVGETVKTVKHKYGDEASDVTVKVMSSAAGTITAFNHLHHIAPRAIAQGATRKGSKPGANDVEDRGSVASFDAEDKKVLDETNEEAASEKAVEKAGFFEETRVLVYSSQYL